MPLLGEPDTSVPIKRVPSLGTMSDVQSSARTLVLTNSDLLPSVFTFLSSWSDNPERLVRCTTVCRNFHEPAIRLLWRKLDYLFPLWHLLAPPNTKCPKRYTFIQDNRLDYLHQVSMRVRTLLCHRVSLTNGAAGHLSPAVRRPRNMGTLSVARHACPSYCTLSSLQRFPGDERGSAPPHTDCPHEK